MELFKPFFNHVWYVLSPIVQESFFNQMVLNAFLLFKKILSFAT